MRGAVRCTWVVVLMGWVGMPASVVGQLPNCTINFDQSCPDPAPECGATFAGGDGCNFIGEPNCYSTGAFSYQVAEGGGVTISLLDDLNSVSVFFAHEVIGGAGSMTFLDSEGQEVGDPLPTDGPCASGPMLPTHVLFFSRAVRSIEVTNAGVGNLWIDTFEVNPPCGDGSDCDDGDGCTTDACDGGACTHTPMDCDDSVACTDDTCVAGNCTHTPMDCDDGVACTDDACDAGACVSTPDDSNCPDDGAFCNGIENCDLQFGCVSSGSPCQTGQLCNEAAGTCDECIADGDCDDDDISTNDACVDGSCVFAAPTGDCPADLDGNGDVGAFDLALLLGSWGPNVGHPLDLNSDGSVGAEDLAILLGSWGLCPGADSSECESDEDCDDGVFCNGVEICDTEDGLCLEGIGPCSDLVCDEDGASCVECAVDADCDDGLFCTGSEVCAQSECAAGAEPCGPDDLCNEIDDSCEPADPDNQNDNGDDEDEDTSGFDDDSDGVPNEADQCPETASGVSVDSAGCSESQTMGDEDDSMMDDGEVDSNGCGAGSCGTVGGMSLAWLFTALCAARVARRRGWPKGKR